ncbi:MAG TPA: EamA family transporter [Jiangellaceae bacterium]|nr:EamA family transporter [Jiangellaceae bacterium]
MARLDAVPAPGLVLLGIVSVQVGAGLAKTLFDVLPPTAVVTLRLATSAVVLVLLARGALRNRMGRWSRSDLTVAVAFGAVLATMNVAIYESFARIPLGIAVTIEFLGPLGVAVAFSRRRLDLVWVLLAAAGVLLLTRGDAGGLDPAGVGFALLAAAGWAAYILLSVATGRRFPGSSGLALASVVGTLLVLPVGVAAGGADLLRPEYLAIGAGIGLLSSAIPYSLELEALRRLPAKLFGILMSLEPAVAALVGLVILGEVLHAREWVAIGCVVTACLGATRSPAAPPETPEA